MRHALLPTLLLAACAGEAPVTSQETTINGFESPSDTAATCEVGNAFVLADLATVPTGFTASPKEVIDQISGHFDGRLTTPEGDVAAWLDIGAAGEIIATPRTWTGDPADAAAAGCEPSYDLAFLGGFGTMDGAFDELFSASVTASASATLFESTIPACDVQGAASALYGGTHGTEGLSITADLEPNDANGHWLGAIAWMPDEAASSSAPAGPIGDFDVWR